MKTISIDAVIVNREDRQRRELANIDELAASISRYGLIQPIVVTQDHELIAGERRLTACRSLGWSEISVVIFEDLSISEQRAIELEENVRRNALEWKDHTVAIADYHQLKKSDDPEWTMGKTADALGMSKQHVSARLQVYKALAEGDEKVAAAAKYSVARGIVERKANRAHDPVSDVVDTFLEKAHADIETLTPRKAIEEMAESVPAPDANFHFVNDSFQEFAYTYTGPKFNFIHCDFPYGINADKHNGGAGDSFDGYEDTPETYWTLCHQLASFLQSGQVAETCHVMFWLSMKYFSETVAFFREAGFTVNYMPLIWHRSDNSGILPDPKRGPRFNTEFALIITKGDRHIAQAVSNCFPNPNTKLIHMSEKPMPVLAHFFRMFVDETTVMLDPTMGSGNAVVAAKEAGAKFSVGVEINEEFYITACETHIK